VQLRSLVHHQEGLLHRHAAQLVALLGRCQVFHHEHEVVRLLVDVGEEDARCVDQRRARKVLVELHLAQVVVERNAGLPALDALGGELAHDRALVGARGILADQAEAIGVPDLAGADAFWREGFYAQLFATGGEHLFDPVGRDACG
jgi:hypothetical protein